jgi:hypothetical protein
MKKTVFFITILAVMLVGATVAFAADVIKTPAEIVSDLTEKPIDDVAEARENGETYGEQAADAGKLDEFKAERLAQYKLALDQAVKEGSITQERADQLYAAMQQRMEACTGTGEGAGLCGRNGNGIGGQGKGFGMGRQNGACGSCFE